MKINISLICNDFLITNMIKISYKTTLPSFIISSKAIKQLYTFFFIWNWIKQLSFSKAITQSFRNWCPISFGADVFTNFIAKNTHFNKNILIKLIDKNVRNKLSTLTAKERINMRTSFSIGLVVYSFSQ